MCVVGTILRLFDLTRTAAPATSRQHAFFSHPPPPYTLQKRRLAGMQTTFVFCSTPGDLLPTSTFTIDRREKKSKTYATH